MGIISLDKLKEKVRWPGIIAETGVQAFNDREYPFCVFKVLPSDPAWPSIDLHFDENLRVLNPLGFSKWHAHYDRWSDDRRNLVEALRTVRELIAGEIGVAEELGTKDDYRGSCLLPPNAIPGTLSKDVRKFRRVFFNKPPKVEDVDFGRYWEGKHLLVEWETKKETEKIWKECGIPIEW